MASRRAVQLLALRTPQAVATRAASIRFTTPCSTPQRTVARNVASAQVGVAQRRHHSSFPSDKRSKVYEFQDVRPLPHSPSAPAQSPSNTPQVLSIVENPSSSTILIDVREPAEFAANSIPTSLNVPITSQPDALLLSEEDFEDRFGFQKPPKEKNVVFFCKAGVRSSAAAQLAKLAGYTKVGEYRGSWLDWERNGGPGTRSGPGAQQP
ncbi:rhodanese-like domain-containing protein [Paraphaeosphaeria sporulosa]